MRENDPAARPAGRRTVKHIFVTGGVVSSLGKGLTCASLAMLLEHHGLKVAMQKMDPYINVDPGTMNPFQHGEVYVTEDGAETDLDLGHYERFTHALVNRHSNYTTGQIYDQVIKKERRGDYLGACIQVIPHITNEIKDAIRRARSDADVVITEIGGTVGDIESLPFLEAIRQFALEEGKAHCMFIHLTPLIYVKAAQELKTKPTQHSVGTLREIGITPDILVCRSEYPVGEDLRRKVSMFCNVEPRYVVEELDVKHTIYEVPLMLHEQGFDALVLERLGLQSRQAPDFTRWKSVVDAAIHPEREVEIAVVGKYIELHDAYKSIYEALAHGGLANRAKVRFRKVNADGLDASNVAKLLGGVAGVLVPGGFGHRGVEGKIEAAKWCMRTGTPYFGICLGMQCATIMAAREMIGLGEAHSSEFVEQCPAPVIDLMEEQKRVTSKGGTMRLGSYPCRLAPGSIAHRAYGKDVVHERHRHRFEFNNAYKKSLTDAGLAITGTWEEGDLAEIVELAGHPWFVGVQFHPEFKSKPAEPHPLFRSFVEASIAHDARAAGANRTAGVSAPVKA
ncbi:MAG: CTP synthase [Planctomycetes bacterium]|nr:CTP synthase [Planctomycetota bacterium]